MIKKLRLFALLNCIVGLSFAQLNGTYTIGGSSPDYNTISDAVTALVANGVNGTTVFEIRSGTYNEQVEITSITGSASNSILFTSEKGHRDSVTIHFDADSADNYVLYLNNVENISFTKLTMKADGSTDYGTVLKIENDIKNVNFLHNQFIGKTGSTSYYTDKCIVRGDIAGNDTNIVFNNNNFVNGRYIMRYNKGVNLEITNNTSDNCDATALYITRGYNVTISGNDLCEDVNPYYANDNYHVFDNVIDGDLQLSYCNADSGKEMLVYNNMIMGRMILRSANHVNVYHNSVYNDGGYAFRIWNTGNSDIKIMNNIFESGSSSDPAVEIDSMAYVDTMNFNIIHSAATEQVSLGTDANYNEYNDLASWQAASGQSANGLFEDPPFKSATDLHLCPFATPRQGGTAGISTDIDGQSRPLPTIGADEIMTTVVTISQNGVTLTASFNDGNSSYQWFLNGVSVVNSDSVRHVAATNGYYHVVVTDSNGCSGTSDSVMVMTVDVDELTNTSMIVYPNPANDQITVAANAAEGIITLRNVLGAVVMGEQVVARQTVLDLSALPKGVYFLELQTADERVVERVVKK